MSAIITSKFRLENANTFISSVGLESMYVMLGKSDPWPNDNITPAAPTDTQVEEYDAWINAIGLKKLDSEDVINVAPRYNWTNNTVYQAWDDNPDDEEIFGKNFFVVNSSYQIFKCLKTPIVSGSPVNSTVEPSLAISFGFVVEDYDAFQTSDGYIWKYMGKISSADISKFMTNSYLPVRTVTLPPGETPTEGNAYWDALTADQQEQYLYQADCATYTSGKIYRYVVTNGGSGYTTAPTVIVHGNGTGAAATALINGAGQVTEVIVTGEDTMMDSEEDYYGSTGVPGYNDNTGSGYTAAYVTFDNTGTGGNSAAARAVLSPKNGHGTDPVRELGGFYVECKILIAGSESGAFPSSGSFRQISLVKNPLNYGTTTVATASALSALKELTLSAGSGTFAAGDTITATNTGSNGAVAFVDSHESLTVKYHQNDTTGYAAFQVSDTVENELAVSRTVAALVNPDVQPFSGEIMFIESRLPINRSVSQVEDIRFIVEF